MNSMKIKKNYNSPKLTSEKIKIGVFGKYGSSSLSNYNIGNPIVFKK